MSRWEGTLAELRAAVIAGLVARPDLADDVDYGPPDTMNRASDAVLAGRVYVGINAATARDVHTRRDPPALAIHGAVTVTVRGWARRQPSDLTRTAGDGTAHSYDEALDRGELILGALLYATSLDGLSLTVLQEEALWRLEITASVEWCPAPLGAP